MGRAPMTIQPHEALIAAAADGFATLDVPESVRLAALAHLRRWMTEGPFRAYQHQIVALVEHERWAQLLDAFYQVLPFGTGGRRGPVGIGPNRFNPWTLGASVQGHAAYLRKTRGEGPLKVVIACDVRCFGDLRGELIAGVPDPVLGQTSVDFARIAAEVYAGAGIAVVLPPEGQVLSTPELSHAIRHLGADGGLNISASHNHPDDNGGKFYNHTGSQEVPPQDEQMANEVASVSFVDRMSLDRARATGLIQNLDPEVHEAYLEVVLAAARERPAGDLQIVFTALHGTGTRTVLPALQRAGYNVVLEPTQAAPDGAFPNVPFRAPNPEVPHSMNAGVAHAHKLGADLVMACDPDADRLGLMVRQTNSDPTATNPVRWVFLSGNQIAALVAHGVLSRRTSTGQPLVFQTEVTSRLVQRVAEARGARVISDLLVGFKYIGDALDRIESTGRAHGIPAALNQFALGAEESHGVLVTPNIRDKDAAGGALVLAALAAREKLEGRTLVDVLDRLQAEVGSVSNTLISTVMRGAVGRQRIVDIQTQLRASPPDEIGGRAVVAFHDRQDVDGPMGTIRSETDRASRDVLVWELEGDARVILRPSGTEPKNKVYAEVCGQPGQRSADVDRDCRALAEAFTTQMLAVAGIHLEPWALRVNDLVSVEHKQHFASIVIPGIEERLSDDDPANAPDLEAWLDRTIAPYGRDARDLVADGVKTWVDHRRPIGGARLLDLFRSGARSAGRAE
jgi:phosphoglucomutase